MKSLLVEELNVLVPNLKPQSITELYQRPFEPQHIILYFDGWEFYEPYKRYIDNSEDSNMIWFEQTIYHINDKELRRPGTLGDFIEDCHSLNIELLWSRSIKDRIPAK